MFDFLKNIFSKNTTKPPVEASTVDQQLELKLETPTITKQEPTKVESVVTKPEIETPPEPQVSELPWIKTAKSFIGTEEIPGSKSNSVIIGWAKALGGWITTFYKDDDIPWCGLFVGYVMKSSGFQVDLKNPLGALEWLKYGKQTTPRYGAIMCFTRTGGGHVGFYMSEDSQYYHILGGNQSNKVSITKIDKSRYAGARWPENNSVMTNKIVKEFDGKVTTNEK